MATPTADKLRIFFPSKYLGADGDPLTARMLCDINPAGDSSPSDIHVVSGQLFFQATAPGIGTEPLPLVWTTF